MWFNMSVAQHSSLSIAFTALLIVIKLSRNFDGSVCIAKSPRAITTPSDASAISEILRIPSSVSILAKIETSFEI
jgi:hypothetical protein